MPCLSLTRTSLRALFTVAACLAVTAPASAEVPLLDGYGGTVGYGTECLGPNDDGTSQMAIDLTPIFPDGLQFFDRTHTTMYVNTNGNVTFGEGLAQYTPEAFPIANQPMIAPYWADVDIRSFQSMMGPLRRVCSGPADGDTTLGAACHEPTENGIWWYLEEGRLVVTWDRVAYYKCRDDLDQRMSFQLVITAVDSGVCGGGGDFDVEFRYNRCEWTTGDASADGTDIPSGGFGGVEAQAGFDAGNSMDFVEIMGSRTADIHTILCSDSNVGDVSADPSLAGIWRFQIRSGEVICPGAGDACDTGMLGVCATGRTSCVGDGLECRPEVMASEEICDGLDNDCDGTVDEEDPAICGDFEECRDGTCVGVCFEGSCPDGYVCNDDRLCVEEACVGVTCGENERCEGGTCIAPCDGVTCPVGLTCVVGQCVDLCEGATCEECSVCVEGACVQECALAGCDAGEACDPTGRCIDADCLGVNCAEGEFCQGGSCIDACTDAVCPEGQICDTGACVEPPPMPDGGVPLPDGGTTPMIDAGTSPMDGGGADVDGGRTIGGGDDGCGCRVVGTQRSEHSPLWLLALGALVFWRRRR